MQIGKFEVKFHWSITFLIAMILSSSVNLFNNLLHGLIAGVITAFTLYSIILLHEMAHIETAHRLGFTESRKITLFALGGVAQISGLRDATPKEELIISIAGPLSNFAMAGGAFLLALLLGIDVFSIANLYTLNISMALTCFFIYNMVLGIFNLIPAFPMDGGRIARATLAIFMPHTKATEIAVYIAWAFSAAFIAFGLSSGMFMLMFIGAFVAFASYGELQAMKQGSRIEYE